MSRTWVNPAIRSAIYLYVALGMTLLVSDGMVSALRYQAAKTFPASFLVVTFLAILGLLALANWNSFQLPIRWRRWIIFCLVAFIGILQLLFAPTRYGYTGV